MNELIGNSEEFIRQLKENIRAEVNNNLIEEIAKIDEQLSVLQSEALKLSRENRQGIIDNEKYDRLIEENAKKQESLISARNEKTLKSEGIKLTEYRISEIERILTETRQGDVFDSAIFKELIETASLTREKILFKFKCGLEIEEKLDQSFRYYPKRN